MPFSKFQTGERLSNQKDRRCYVFDIDGTLADNTHRLHHIPKEGKHGNWDEFNSLAHKDSPISPMIEINNLLYADQRHNIVLATARDHTNYDLTSEWLFRHNVKFDVLYMRGPENRESDHILKFDMAKDIEDNYGNIIAVFEDRKSVKQMWVEYGAFVFDANQHDEHF